jgi:hypothetical protein
MAYPWALVPRWRRARSGGVRVRTWGVRSGLRRPGLVIDAYAARPCQCSGFTRLLRILAGICPACNFLASGVFSLASQFPGELPKQT